MEKIKQFFKQNLLSEQGKDILVVAIVVLVGLGSFELGRLSKTAISSNNNQPASIQPENFTQPNTKTSEASSNAIPTSKNFFASSRGTKYYSLTCSAGKSIKQENRVYFDTAQEAETAGYTLSTSCK